MRILYLLRRLCPESVKPFARWLFSQSKYIYYWLFAKVFASKLKYFCPCCGLVLAKFAERNFSRNPDYYNPERYKTCCQAVICPCCGSLARHRILAVWSEQNLASLRDKHILYFALENGMKRWFKRYGLAVTTADLFYAADLKLDMVSIEQPDCSWDIVVCNHVLEHVMDYKKALSELHRILVPGGRLICSFPIDDNFETVYEDVLLVEDVSREADWQRINKFGQRTHFRIFGRDSTELLEMAGFTVTVIDGETMPKEILPVVGPADYDSNKLFVCVKK